MSCNQDVIATTEDKDDSCTLLCVAFTQTQPSSLFFLFLGLCIRFLTFLHVFKLICMLCAIALCFCQPHYCIARDHMYTHKVPVPVLIVFVKGEVRAICQFSVFDRNGLLGHRLIDSRWFEKNPPTEIG